MEPQIKSTRDYSLFKFHPLNRPLSKKHLTDMTKSLRENNQLDINPIIVDKDWQIISGQHRFLAAKRLNLPIYYVQKDMDIEYILHANQLQKRTTNDEAVKFYVSCAENPDYKILNDLKVELKIPYGCVAALLGHNVGKKRIVVDGSFLIGDNPDKQLEKVDKYRKLKAFLDTQNFEYANAYKSTIFCQGFRRFIDVEDVDFDQFMKKIRIYWPMLDCAQAGYLAWCKRFVEIYNKKRHHHFLKIDGVNE